MRPATACGARFVRVSEGEYQVTGMAHGPQGGIGAPAEGAHGHLDLGLDGLHEAASAEGEPFAVTVPADFTSDLIRGEHPQILVQADASDPSAASNAMAAILQLAQSALKDDLVGPLAAGLNTPSLAIGLCRKCQSVSC